MYWFWLILIFVLFLAWFAIGIYMIYSAISGKGIPRPDEKSLWQIKTQYRLRGLIGLAFAVASGTGIFGLIQMLMN